MHGCTLLLILLVKTACSGWPFKRELLTKIGVEPDFVITRVGCSFSSIKWSPMLILQVDSYLTISAGDSGAGSDNGQNVNVCCCAL